MKRASGALRRWVAGLLPLVLVLAQTGCPGPSGEKDPIVSAPGTVGVRLLTDSDYLAALLDGIHQARQEVCFSFYLFRTMEDGRGGPEAVLQSLVAAAARGVRVEAILESNHENDDLDRNNVETARRLRERGIRVCLDAPDRQTHTKLVVIDRRYVLIGSHNLTQSALKYNREASVWIDSVPLAEQAIRYMESICPARDGEAGNRRK